MNLRTLCPAPLFPLLQKAAAAPDRLTLAHARRTRPQNPHGVLLISPSRSTLSGNHAFVAEALKGTEFTVSTLLEGDAATRRERLQKCAENRFILLDDYTRWLYPLNLSPQTRVIQLWHSTGAFKRMGFARMGRPGSTVATSLTHRNYTHVIVSAPGVVPAFAEAFGLPEERIYPIGVPRTDFFFDPPAMEAARQAFFARYPALQGKKIVLFAPTFRGNDRAAAHYPAEWFDPAALLAALPDDYALCLKLHPFIRTPLPVPAAAADRVVDLSAEREINPLLLAADVLITDYSSVIFEYALLGRPIVFYLPDRAAYERDRDFFFDLSTYLYGPVCTRQSELPAAILTPAPAPVDRAEFISTFLSACDGHATERLVELLRREAAC